jgi:hypothetical protein
MPGVLIVNRSKAKGTKWATAIVDFLRDNGVPYAEKRNQCGSRDRGDIAGIPLVVVEAKDDPSLSVQAMLREAEAERVNDRADIGVAWTKVRGKASAGDGIVHMTPATFLFLLQGAGYVPKEGIAA